VTLRARLRAALEAVPNLPAMTWEQFEAVLDALEEALEEPHD